MRTKRTNQELVLKIVVVGVLTAMSIGLSMIKLPITGVSVTLLLPVVIIGAALYGPWVGAWLTVVPNIIACFTEGALFFNWSPVGCVLTLLLKGILAGIASGFIYKALSKKHPIGAITCSAVAAPILNSGVFLLGCYIFIWDHMVAEAVAEGYTAAAVLLGLGFNFVVELILNIVLCPAIFKILQIVTKKKLI